MNGIDLVSYQEACLIRNREMEIYNCIINPFRWRVDALVLTKEWNVNSFKFFVL